MKKKKIALITIGVIFAILALVVWWQFENIKSVYFYFTYSGDDIDAMIRESDKEVTEYLESNPDISVRPTDDVEEKLHQSGVISDEELVAVIMGHTSVEELLGTEVTLTEDKKFVDSQTGEVVSVEKLKEIKSETAKNKPVESDPTGKALPPATKGETSSESKSPSDSLSSKENGLADGGQKNSGTASDSRPQNGQTDEQGNKENSYSEPPSGSASSSDSTQVSQYVAQMYVLKSTFSGQINALYQEAVSSYKALPSSEKNDAGKSAIIKQIYPKASALEASCDSQVAALLGELEAVLVSSGQSTELVTKMRNAYYQEKSLVKAQYMNEL